MPITGSFTWTEKSDVVKVIVPLKGVSPKKVDIFVTSTTLKINFSPYIVDIFLYSSIDAVKHKATVKEGNLQITLYKTSPGLWGTLENDTADKALISKLREDSLNVQDALEKELSDKRRERRTDDERYSLRKQMGLDESERNRLDSLKQEEKRAAEQEVYETFARMQCAKDSVEKKVEKSDIAAPKSTSMQVKAPVDFETYLRENEEKLSSTTNISSTTSIITKDIFDDSNIEVIDSDREQLGDDEADYSERSSRRSDSSGEVKNIVESNHIVEKEADDVRYIPPPRILSSSADGKGKFDIQFTPRVFPTPMRESKLAEEDDWIAKNRRHLKKHGVLGNNSKKGSGWDASEEDPSWLKAKGDDFFRGGDFRSALNAYSAAVDLDENMTACYSNRSACYLKLKMFAECRLDCSEGIRQVDEELTAMTSSNSSASALSDTANKEIIVLKVLLSKLLLRKGCSNCQMGLFSEALNDYKRTYNLLYGYEDKRDSNSRKDTESLDVEFSLPGITKSSLSADIERVVKLLNSDLLKKEGDALFGEDKLPASCGKYTEALDLVPVHVGCLSNRSACRLAMKDVEGCIEDCSSALSLLQEEYDTAGQDSADNINMLNSILPSAGSDKRRSWVVKTLLRRGAAYAQLGEMDEAVEDYRSAAALDPKNEALKSDLNKIINYREGKKIVAT